MRPGLHSVLGILAGTGAFVFAVGGVEPVGDAELHARVVAVVALADHTVAVIGFVVVDAAVEDVIPGEADVQGIVLKE